MENTNQAGYVTEKILDAFIGGAVPIYWGASDVFDIFNRDAFIYFDPENPNEALNRVKYLESNLTAYMEIQYSLLGRSRDIFPLLIIFMVGR
jgi:alpha(1,3/1,4) fucosyltransferase